MSEGVKSEELKQTFMEFSEQYELCLPSLHDYYIYIRDKFDNFVQDWTEKSSKYGMFLWFVSGSQHCKKE